MHFRILPEDGAALAPEVCTHQLARLLGRAVPAVLAYEACNPTIQRSTMLAIKISGQPVCRSRDLPSLHRSIRFWSQARIVH